MNLILLGPPGAGKGTLAEKLSAELNIPHISTGDLFRAAIKEMTSLGLKVKSILDAGDLVPDDLTIALVEERLSKNDAENGFILDGFPRTIPQAEAFGRLKKIDHVVNFVLGETVVIKRLSGRRICSNCGKGYHVDFLPPQQLDICDVCGKELIIRKDDHIDSIKNRLSVYREQTEPLIAFYSAEGLIRDIDASTTIEKVFVQVVSTVS